MNIGSIFVSLGFKANTKPVANFSKEIAGLQRGITQLGIAFTGSLFALKQFVGSGLEASNSIINFKNQTGLAVEQLNQLAQAGRSVSASLDVGNITNDVIGFEKSIQRIRLGQGSIAPFQKLGIDVLESNAFGVLEQLRNRIEGLSDPMATILLEDIGLNPNFLQILRLTRQEFDKLGKNTFLSENQAKIINKVGLQARNLTTEFINLKNRAIVQLAPYFTQFMNDTFKWLANNGGKVVSAISDIVKGVGRFTQAISEALGFAGRMVEGLLGVENGVKAIGVALGLILMPFKKIMFPVIALVVLLEDISLYLKGYDTPLKGFYDAVAMIHKEFVDMKLTIGLIIGSIGAVMFALGKRVSGGALVGLGGALGFSGFLDTIDKNFAKKIAEGTAPEQFANKNQMEMARSMSTSNSSYTKQSTNNTTLNINIDGALDPVEIGKRVKEKALEVLDEINLGGNSVNDVLISENKDTMSSQSSFR